VGGLVSMREVTRYEVSFAWYEHTDDIQTRTDGQTPTPTDTYTDRRTLIHRRSMVGKLCVGSEGEGAYAVSEESAMRGVCVCARERLNS
jgi:hypothetical protein